MRPSGAASCPVAFDLSHRHFHVVLFEMELANQDLHTLFPREVQFFAGSTANFYQLLSTPEVVPAKKKART